MTERWNDWAPLPLQLVFGIGFVIHGYPKLFGGHEGFAGMLEDLGILARCPTEVERRSPEAGV